MEKSRRNGWQTESVPDHCFTLVASALLALLVVVFGDFLLQYFRSSKYCSRYGQNDHDTILAGFNFVAAAPPALQALAFVAY